MKWYIVHTYSGHENRAKLSLLERVQAATRHTDKFGDIRIPPDTVDERGRKLFPGYMLVQMDLDQETFNLVVQTPKITGFLGGPKPTPVPEREIGRWEKG